MAAAVSYVPVCPAEMWSKTGLLCSTRFGGSGGVRVWGASAGFDEEPVMPTWEPEFLGRFLRPPAWEMVSDTVRPAVGSGGAVSAEVRYGGGYRQ